MNGCKACEHRNGGRHTCTPAQRYERDVIRGGCCWGWRGYTDSQGYGFVTVRGRHVAAHRFSWEAANGPLPAGMCVLHRCDNPVCSNPTHLFIGTRAENAKDRDRKGRTRNGNAAKTCCSRCGKPFDRIRPDGHRECVACQRERVREWCRRNRRKQAA